MSLRFSIVLIAGPLFVGCAHARSPQDVPEETEPACAAANGAPQGWQSVRLIDTVAIAVLVPSSYQRLSGRWDGVIAGNRAIVVATAVSTRLRHAERAIEAIDGFPVAPTNRGGHGSVLFLTCPVKLLDQEAALTQGVYNGPGGSGYYVRTILKDGDLSVTVEGHGRTRSDLAEVIQIIQSIHPD